MRFFPGRRGTFNFFIAMRSVPKGVSQALKLELITSVGHVILETWLMKWLSLIKEMRNDDKPNHNDHEDTDRGKQ